MSTTLDRAAIEKLAVAKPSLTLGAALSCTRVVNDRKSKDSQAVSFSNFPGFFNIANHTNPGPPDDPLTDVLFVRSTQARASNLGSGGANARFNPLYQIVGPYSVQLTLQ